MKRYFIGVTGTATAGKSTLGSALLSEFVSPKIFPIPHTTYRAPRQDDDPRLIRCISKEEYSQRLFLTRDGNYGTLQDDYQEFLNSKRDISLSVVSCYEVADIKKKLEQDNVVPIFISVTLTDNSVDEKEMIIKRYPLFFKGEDLAWRVSLNTELSDEFFFNSEYLKNNNIISLYQKNTPVLTWIKKIEQYVPIKVDSYFEQRFQILSRVPHD